MLKKLIVALALLAFFSTTHATVFLINPVEAELGEGALVELGKVAKGETFEIIVEKKSGFPFQWESIEVDSTALPTGWVVEKDSSPQTLILRVSVPVSAKESIQNIPVEVFSPDNNGTSQSFTAEIVVKKNLLRAEVKSLAKDAIVYEPVVFSAVIINDSIAPHAVVVYSSLPNYWFEPVSLELKSKETKDFNLVVFPKTYGKRDFSFFINSQLNGFSKEIPAELFVFPTLKNKFEAPLFGFPFFSIQALPYYLVNSFLALIS